LLLSTRLLHDIKAASVATIIIIMIIIIIIIIQFVFIDVPNDQLRVHKQRYTQKQINKGNKQDTNETNKKYAKTKHHTNKTKTMSY
jgi:choline-glycine betaine transporter